MNDNSTTVLDFMNTVDTNLLTKTSRPNDSYDIFINKFTKIYDQAFP